ncbi:hypothetical protein [Hymenobacter bucti]|uniref:YHYH domain-containing protein n=1 Tax=Hymenobacter bucti TaxID=1844114 RepID=A0ABW4QTZ9_9BACT
MAKHVLGPYLDSGSDAGVRMLHAVPGHAQHPRPGHHCHTLSPNGRTEYLVYHA